MQVTLINSVNGKDVHGTINGKRTGCGINLTRADNISKYVKGKTMDDLKEITCEKCKMSLAKRIIKESQKQLSRQLKEESKRVAQGLAPIEEEPEKKTVGIIDKVKSRVLGDNEMIQPKAFDNEPKANEKISKQIPQNTYNQPKTNEVVAKKVAEPVSRESPVGIADKPNLVANDDFLSQFAISVPKVEEEPEKKIEKKPKPSVSKVILDDELEQFAIPQPKVEEKPKPSVSKVILDDELEQFAIPQPKVEEKPKPSVSKVILDDDLEQFAIPQPKAEEKPKPSVSKVILDDDLEQFAIPQPKAEEKPKPSVSKAVLDDELEQFAIPQPKAEEKPFNIKDINDIMINPAREKSKIDNKTEKMSEINIDFEDMDKLIMDDISPVKDESVQQVQPVEEIVQEAEDVPNRKSEVQFQPSGISNPQPVQEEEIQPDMQEINTDDTKDTQQVIYNELGQPLYPVYNEKGQLFYTAVAPTKKQPEPDVAVKEEEVNINPTPNPTIASIIAANAKKKAVINDSGEMKITEPIVDSVEAALSQLGASVDEKKKKEPIPVYTEYKPPSRKNVENAQIKKPEKNAEQNVPLTRAEIRRQKKLEKINNEFEKKLRERGFDIDESKRKKRATR